MQIYFAPLEGITGVTFRNAYEDCFPGQVDKYFAPFIPGSSIKKLASKDVKELAPDNNPKVPLVPQILTKTPEDFIQTASAICELGYQEINLNVGCPSRTVVAKLKGSGLLLELPLLRTLLDGIYTWSEREGIQISVKTRIGFYEEEEWSGILSIYNEYPISELIVHPRTQKDFYKNMPHMVTFDHAVGQAKHTLCYNGDILSSDDLNRLQSQYPQVDRWMIGRGFITRPGFLTQDNETDFQRMWRFHDRMLKEYQEVISGDTHLMFKMKELWCYFREQVSPEDTQFAKLMKKLNKCKSLREYQDVIGMLKGHLS